jgi:putative pyruvate formate lyase activating enzyme
MRLGPRELRARAQSAAESYRDCLLCAHRCRVDRTRGPAGRCHEGTSVFLAGAGLHFGEEPPLVGRRGSGLVLVGGCNLACSSCETAAFSLLRRGVTECSEGQLAALFLDLQRRGAANLNLVTPTHVLPALLGGLARAAEHAFDLPVVWNCGGYESLEALALLDGIVDVYLPDAKYGDDAAALQLSGCARYTGALAESLREMHRQAGNLQLGRDGLATRGVLVRHLVLPGGVASPSEAMRIVASVSPDMWVNVLSQYRPVHEAQRFPVVARTVRGDEVRAAVDAALSAGLRNVLVDGCPAARTTTAHAGSPPREPC